MTILSNKSWELYMGVGNTNGLSYSFLVSKFLATKSANPILHDWRFYMTGALSFGRDLRWDVGGCLFVSWTGAGLWESRNDNQHCQTTSPFIIILLVDYNAKGERFAIFIRFISLLFHLAILLTHYTGWRRSTTNGRGKLTQMGSRGFERASVPKLDLGEQTCLLIFFRVLSSLLLNYKFVHPFSSRRRRKGPNRAWPSNRAALGGDIDGTRYVCQKLICICILFAIVCHLITKMLMLFLISWVQRAKMGLWKRHEGTALSLQGIEHNPGWRWGFSSILSCFTFSLSVYSNHKIEWFPFLTSTRVTRSRTVQQGKTWSEMTSRLTRRTTTSNRCKGGGGLGGEH